MERYEAYKDSGIEWIGGIPAHWQLRRISALYDARNEKVSDQDYPPLSVTMQGIVPQLETAAKTQDGDNRKLVRTGDFVINSRSDRRGACGISAYDGSVTLISNVLAPKDRNAMSTRYYSYLFRSEGFADEFYRQGTGIVDDLWSTNWTRMKNILVARPPHAEQERIADYLDTRTAEIDALVADCEREVELLQEYRKVVISEAVTKGLNPDAPMKDSGVEWIGEIPETWSIAKVKSCCDILPGYAFKSELFMQESDSVKLLRGINLGVNVIRWDEVVSYPLDAIEELSTYRLLAGDVVIGLDRPWIKEGLRIAIIQDERFEQYLVQRVARLRVSSELDVRFVKYALESGLLEYELDSLTTGVSVPHISTEQIGSTRIALPDIATQHEIVALLDSKTAEIDSLIETKQSMVDKLREYRRSLISEAVTGKFKVPGV